MRLVGLRCVPSRPSTTRGTAYVAAFEDRHFRGRASVEEEPLTLVTFTPALPTRPWSCRPSVTARATSLGIVQRTPLRRLHHRGVHSRRTAPANRPDLLRRGATSSSRVPTSWSFPPRRLPPPRRPAGCCTACPTLGFTTFPPGPPPRTPSRTTWTLDRASPRCLPALRSLSPVHSGRSDSRESSRREDVTATDGPPSSAFTALLAPSPSPSPRGRSANAPPTRPGLDLEALLRARIRCVSCRCRRDPPDAPLGLDAARLDHPSRSVAASVFRRCRPEGRCARKASGTSKTVREERLSVRTPGCPGVADP